MVRARYERRAFIGLLLLNAPWWVGALLLFIPVFIGAIGYLQVKNRFCVSYGASGKQNANEDSDLPKKVSEQTAIEADKRKSRTMNLQASVFTVVVVSLASLLLHFA